MTRRVFLGTAPALLLSAPRGREARIENLTYEFEDFRYRTPYKFGGREVDRVTLLNVKCSIRGRDGKTAQGFGSMPMGNVWSFPSATMPYDRTLTAMKSLAARIADLTRGYKDYAHPIDINWDLEPAYLQAAAAVSDELKLDQSIPKLCMLVTASPFDAAIHDAYGKLHGKSVFQCYSSEFMGHDLGHYLGKEYKGEYADKYVRGTPVPELPIYHSAGASDPIAPEDVKKPIGDGLPENLPEWIRFNGLTNIKIKLNGDDLKWDVDRVLHIDDVAMHTKQQEWLYSLDFNERCPNVDYLLNFLKQVKQKAPVCFNHIQLIEQPTKRDLAKDRANVMHEAAKYRPVVIDESLVDQETLMLAREMGYTGAAIKACKGQSHSLLMAAVAQKYKMFLCAQDLTCPGASFVHSATLAAHVPGVAGLEANAREYVPVANREWEKRMPEIFVIRDGRMKTRVLDRAGLGAV